MKRFNKRPTEGAVARILDAYRPASMPGTDCRHSLREYAHKNGLRPNDVFQSYWNLIDVVPSLSGHAVVGAVYHRGARRDEIWLDTVGYLAWLHWRKVSGHLPKALLERRKRHE